METSLIIFDFDGVIADTFDIIHSLKQIEYPDLTADEYRTKFNGNIHLAEYSTPRAKEIDFQTELANKMQGFVIDPVKKDAVLQIASVAPCYIVSSTHSDTIKLFNRVNGIDGCFKDVLGLDVFASKVKKFKKIIETQQIAPESILFITDTVGDIKEAHEAGITNVLAVTSGYQNEETLRAANPTWLVPSIVEAVPVVLQKK